MKLKELTKENYEQTLAQMTNFSFMQSKEMCDLLDRQGNQVHYIGLEVDGNLEIIASLYSRKMLGGLRMELHSGPVYSKPDHLLSFYRLLQTYAKKHNVLELVVKPYEDFQIFDKNGNPLSDSFHDQLTSLQTIGFQHDGLTVGYPNGESTWHFVKDLTDLTEDQLLKSYNKNGQRLVKKARKVGLKVRNLERNELQIFKDIQDSTAERNGYAAKPLSYYENLFDMFGDKAEFLTATIHFQDYLEKLQEENKALKKSLANLEKQLEKNSTKKLTANYKHSLGLLDKKEAEIQQILPYAQKFGNTEIALASNLVLYSSAEVTYLFGGFYTDYNFLAAPALLQDAAMTKAIKRGIPLYNFLGIQGKFDGCDGVLRFKQNFNGYIVRKMGTFRYYPKPTTYKIIQFAKKALAR
ncbi:aminoacyltransferase [Streptococcus loxodontisalivarius]|uniref:Alanine adding enzyme n=1 Tax=Streptococcus loxodontisalivarius TaxID=1349415 RepID=A0ABS2PTB6_9STRE|nr:aminoacyltransferase [Streptococcus loxodontisalivarius]MBM7642754.1 alanine adding enzyme [Streptococcus loxodontisalivarius]